MARYTLLFLAWFGVGAYAANELVARAGLSMGWAGLVASAVFSAPLAAWVWFGTVAPARAQRKQT
jgi:hypothetical protein